MVAGIIARLFGPNDRRRVVTTADGLRLHLDPLSHIGETVLGTGSFEPETAAIFAREIRAGDAVLDVGANEGYFSALAAKLAGPGGFIAAVEPQQTLRAVIEKNLQLNDAGRFLIFSSAMGEPDGTTAAINVFPALNNGATSFVRRPRWSWRTEPVTFVSMETILAQSAVEKFDFVKIDVEGFENKVVDAMLPGIRAGKVRTLLLDYHASILRQAGVNPAATHRALLDTGMHADAVPDPLDGYVLYQRSA